MSQACVGRRDRILDWMHNRLAPAIISRRHDQKRTPVCVRAHRSGKLHEKIYRVVIFTPLLWRSESQQGRQQRRTVWQARAFLIYDLDALPFQHSDIGRLSKTIETAMFDNEQARLDHFQDETKTGNLARRTPDS